MAVVMMMETSVSAFAAEATAFANENNTVCETNMMDESSDTEVSVVNDTVGTTISAGKNGHVYPTLDSYIGVSKSINISIAPSNGSSSATGRVRVYLFKPNDGSLMKYWEVSEIGTTIKESFTLPSSGTYSVLIYNETDTEIVVTAHWS